MFTYRIYGRADGAKRPSLLCASDYRDVALFVRDNIAKAFGEADNEKLEITMTECRDATFFSRLKDPNPETEDQAEKYGSC